MLSPSLRQIEYALAIGRHGGLSAAAAALHVSQPALSVALAELESHLGHPLFLRRKGRPMQPSAFGVQWLAEAGRAVAGLTDLFRPAGPPPLRLALFEDLAPMVLAPLLAQSDRFGLAPHTRSLGFAALSSALSQGEVDLALTWDLGLPAEVARRELLRLGPMAVLATDHPLASHAELTLQDLVSLPLVLADQDLSIAHWQVLFAQAGLSPHIAHRCASLDLMRAFAAHGLGIGLSYAQPAPRLSHDGRPFVLVPLRDVGTEALMLAWPQARAPHHPLDELATFLAAHFRPVVKAI